MAVTKTLSNRLKYEFGKGEIDFLNDTFKAILMEENDTFDRTTDAFYGLVGSAGSVASREVADGNGYTTGGLTLSASSVWAQDNVGDKASIEWADATWTASTGDIGPTAASIVLKHDSGTLANSLVVGCIDFGENITVTDGVSFQLQDLGFDLIQGA